MQFHPKRTIYVGERSKNTNTLRARIMRFTTHSTPTKLQFDFHKSYHKKTFVAISRRWRWSKSWVEEARNIYERVHQLPGRPLRGHWLATRRGKKVGFRRLDRLCKWFVHGKASLKRSREGKGDHTSADGVCVGVSLFLQVSTSSYGDLNYYRSGGVSDPTISLSKGPVYINYLLMASRFLLFVRIR
jgi:hypothetical protein